MEILQPKVLVFDIETAPMLAFVWGHREQHIGLNQLKSDWYVIAWAAKWLGDPASKTLYMDQRTSKDIEDDRAILYPLWKLLDEADIVITQNGKNFDSKKLNARFITHGMAPPSPYSHWDTYQVIRRVAAFTSNSLEYLTNKLCTKYKKLTHKKFPGMELWKQCLAGNKEAWDEMKRYNIHDVLATEEFYDKIKAWAPKSAPHVFVVNPVENCSSCGGSVKRAGTRLQKNGLCQQFQCTQCGRWHQEKIKKAA